MAGSLQRVLLSHTSKLREFPPDRSFVAAEATVARAGDALSSVCYFAARDGKPSRYCQDTVRGCGLCVRLIGLRYGSPVRDHREVPHTELESDTATQTRLARLIFEFDKNGALPVPPTRCLTTTPFTGPGHALVVWGRCNKGLR